MTFTLDLSGLDDLRARIATARSQVQPLMQEAVQQAGEYVASELGANAPRGKGEEGPPPAGDAEGRLFESFYTQEESPPSASGAAMSVRTKQPTKLKFVVEGRGEVRPVVKKALYWPGLDHPVRRAGPSQPNDFVSGVVQNAPTADEALSIAIEELKAILEG